MSNMSAGRNHANHTGSQRRPIVHEIQRRYHVGKTGDQIGGTVGAFLNAQCVVPLFNCIRNRGNHIDFIFSYYGRRYHLVLEYNQDLHHCIENKLLENVYIAVENNFCDDSDDRGLAKCLDLFWPFVAAYHERHIDTCGPAELSAEDRYRSKEVIKIQLKISYAGTLSLSAHNKKVNFPPRYPIKNPCPGVPIFKENEIEVLAAIDKNPKLFKVKAKGRECCLKVARHDAFEREVTMLAKMPTNPSLPQLVGVLDSGDGCVDRFLTPFVPGKSLAFTFEATSSQKAQWKKQISDAVRLLHERDMVWGDVKPDNVMIHSESKRAILVDFGGSYSEGWVDEELNETKEGDLQGVRRIMQFIDRLDTKSERI